MNRKCTGCGWEFAPKEPVDMCPWCGSPLDSYRCTLCGGTFSYQDMEKTNLNHCLSCEQNKSKIYNRNHYKKVQALREEAKQDFVKIYLGYEALLKKIINKAPKPVPMKETAWYKAIKHFDGCCLCNSDAELQWLFLRPDQGGSYSSTNVLPLCSKCYKKITKYDNPLASLDCRLNNEADKKDLMKLLEGLQWLGYQL